MSQIQIIEDPEVPVYNSKYKPKPFNLNSHPTPEALQAVEKETMKFNQAKSEDPSGLLKNITIKSYSTGNPKQGNFKKYPMIKLFEIKGKTEADFNYYKGHHFTGRIEFPDEYPNKPPVVVFDYLLNGQPLQIVNLYGDGVACHTTLNQEYYNSNKHHLVYIMKQLQQFIYQPNPQDPANYQLGKYYQDYPDSYWIFQRKQAQNLPINNEQSDQQQQS